MDRIRIYVSEDWRLAIGLAVCFALMLLAAVVSASA
jgi:hypothetical protein